MNFNDKASMYDQIATSQNEAADALYKDIKNFCSLKPTSNILDLGCGTGYITRKLADDFDFVTGIDTSEKMLEQAADNGGNIEYVLRDASKLNETCEYDLITANSLTYYIADLESAFNSYYLALKPKGYLALQSQTEVTPQFWDAFQALRENKESQQFIENYKFPANMQSQHTLAHYLKEAGFSILLEKTIHFKTLCNIETALAIFMSGTATPLLNQKAYSLALTDRYIEIFWDTIQKEFTKQAVDGQILLDIPRAFLIVQK
ncbi:class I SAM-dependent DNA methyltransferase [Piscirickettsia salmonis]|uniref:class I SAM-dependent DNA methyltransferase n=1 Tax=Piscirickettsia salmonis TaxID=1238 RepID=UPI003EBF5AEB